MSTSDVCGRRELLETEVSLVGLYSFTMTDDELAEVFNAGGALRNAVEQIGSSNDEAEIR